MSFLCYFNILSCFCQRISSVFLSHALSSYPCKRWVLVVIENIIFPLVVCSNTDDHADGDIHTQSRCAAGTQKRQWNTDYWHDFQNHTDIHKQWVKIIEDTPIHRNIPCRSFARSPFASVRRQRKTITNTTAIAPTKPSVCPI